MLLSYAEGEAVEITLPNDKDNPTIVAVYPMFVRDRNRNMAIMSRLKERFDRMSELTVDNDVEAADRLTAEETGFIASRIKYLSNAYKRGEHANPEAKPGTLTEQSDIIEWIDGLPAEDRNVLIAATMSSKRLELLRKQ